ncbi:hypothetical protein KNP414_01998 [Paenibacillus mucilaginosus KNP414]|uniref:Uncharacterized protein n=1 Tax=Paenibacillus mucilaginosus (strain KNP414) TaxID=1036673 RepID=F8FRK2_PAEMK|nr:hypothetical protein KNP414_01998 [Paenibacillus mucilaginosus KNP414]
MAGPLCPEGGESSLDVGLFLQDAAEKESAARKQHNGNAVQASSR